MKEIESEADFLAHRTKRQQELTLEADRPFTKMLFGLWLVLVVALLFVSMAALGHDDTGRSQAFISITHLMVVITGAYTFQEAKRLHKRVDAIRKLNQMKASNKPIDGD